MTTTEPATIGSVRLMPFQPGAEVDGQRVIGM